MISGPSGSGKSSIVTALRAARDIQFSVSATTRERRIGERHGEHYWFVSRSEFEDMVARGEFLEWAEYNGNLYGTPALPVSTAIESGQDVVLEIELQGARQIRASKPDALMFFIAPPSLEELEDRLRGRGDTTDADISERLSIAKHEIEEAPSLFDFIVVNSILDDAVEEIGDLIRDSTSGNL